MSQLVTSHSLLYLQQLDSSPSLCVLPDPADISQAALMFYTVSLSYLSVILSFLIFCGTIFSTCLFLFLTFLSYLSNHYTSKGSLSIPVFILFTLTYKSLSVNLPLRFIKPLGWDTSILKFSMSQTEHPSSTHPWLPPTLSSPNTQLQVKQKWKACIFPLVFFMMNCTSIYIIKYGIGNHSVISAVASASISLNWISGLSLLHLYIYLTQFSTMVWVPVTNNTS